MSTSLPTAPSTIRVFVQWKEQTVWAGEDIECKITFKNVATAPTPPRASPHPSNHNAFPSGGPRKTTQVRNGSPLNPRPGNPGKGHRSTLSLNVPAAPLRSQPASTSWSARNAAKSPREGGGQHKRSVSIISIGVSESVAEDTASHGSVVERPRGLSRGHGRSASLQIVPRGLGINGAPIPSPSQRSTTQPSPLFSFPSNTSEHGQLGERPTRRQVGVATAPNTPGISGGPFTRRKGSGTIPQTFKFPAISTPNGDSQPAGYFNGDNNQDSHDRLLSPRSKESIHAAIPKAIQNTKILSPASATGTPRSSGEFYSLSNNSTETLASEYVPQPTGRAPPFIGHARRSSNISPVNHHRPPETLMMGYAQINGSFTLDASLISQTPFDEVKRKGAVGGQGGGVIGVETSKRESGLLKSFGWGNIGESLGGLLGGGELSSMKDMRGIASSRAIPLLSTPQSILFVDLRLTPGESRSYEYSFKLPRGLPPSHRGKAIKISYKLVIGTQRPGGSKEQQVRSVEIPFRILGSVNTHGELLGHDLMAPYIILRDQARVKTIENTGYGALDSSQEPKASKPIDSTSDDFLAYVDELLTRPRQNSSLGLLSPTEGPRSRRQSMVEEPATAKEAVDMAILRSNVATEMQQSANRFEIARSGKRVAVIMLARPAYRLGETINAAIDFTDAEIPCYAVHMTLETSEKVDHSIALRSEASILRVTRKIHVSHSESTLFARRVVFSPTVPVSATPEFITTGVSLDWRIRIEFVTPLLYSGEGNELLASQTDLLEEITRDDRGAVFASAETLQCESFEIAVPLRVYGAAGNAEKDEGLLDGLVV